MARSTGSSAVTACTAARVSAGAVPRPHDSSRIAFGRTPTAASCSLTMKRWPSLHTTIGSTEALKPRVRPAVCCSSVRSPFSAWSCFGYCSRESGQRRVPEPPHRITGWISVGVTPSSIMDFWGWLQDSGDPSSLAEELLVTPVCDKAGVVVCPCALPHLAHLLGERFSPGEPAREVAAGAGLEQQAVTARLDQVGERTLAARDHRQCVRERLDQRSRQCLVAQARQHQVSGAAHAVLHFCRARSAE